MNEDGKKDKRLSLRPKTNEHLPAMRDFTQFTINNPEFFSLSSEEQKRIASEFIAKHKVVPLKREEASE